MQAASELQTDTGERGRGAAGGMQDNNNEKKCKKIKGRGGGNNKLQRLKGKVRSERGGEGGKRK